VTLLGIAALFVLGMMFFNPDFADKIIAMSPFSAEEPVEQAEPVVPPLASLMDTPAASFATTGATASSVAAGPMTAEERQMIGNPRQQKLVTNWLAKRYRVAGDATDMLVSAAYLTAREIKLDPLLILAVMAIESRFNPFAESPMGAQGLMQVMSKIHHDKFQELGGVKAALNPVANIKVGSLILKEYVTRGGSVEAGLKTYVGAAEMENDGGYGAKVLSEYHKPEGSRDWQERVDIHHGHRATSDCCGSAEECQRRGSCLCRQKAGWYRRAIRSTVRQIALHAQRATAIKKGASAPFFTSVPEMPVR